MTSKLSQNDKITRQQHRLPNRTGRRSEPLSSLALLDSRSPITVIYGSSDGSEGKPARQQLETQDEEPRVDGCPD